MLIEKPFQRAVAKAAVAEAKAYTVLVSFWHAGLKRAEGEVIHLTDAAAKYWKHAITPVVAKAAAPAVAPAPVAAPAPAPAPDVKPAAAPAAKADTAAANAKS